MEHRGRGMGRLPDYPDFRDYTDKNEKISTALEPTNVLKAGRTTELSVDLPFLTASISGKEYIPETASLHPVNIW